MSDQTNTSDNITCKNCSTEFIGNFCPNCGQNIREYNQPFGMLIYDLAGNMFAFDTRLWKTLKAVLFLPGKMAHEFILGHRVRYMPPFRFYVFVSFIFFMMLNYTTFKNYDGSKINLGKNGISIHDSVKEEVGEVIDSVIVNNTMSEDERKELKKIKQSIDKGEIGPGGEFKDVYNEIISTPDEKLDSKDEKKLKDILKHPEYYFPQFIKYLSWFLFLLMPLYGAFLWLFFHKKYKYYLGHLIFAINQHSFLFVIFILMMGIKLIFPNKESSIENYLFFLIPIYSIIGARKLYQRKWSNIIFKLVAIFFMYSFLLLIALAMSLYVTFV
ncbi:DUF3667 domain-containing protein [Labilibacter marinus]|uniref:DUF3667 domain-containing protein n=1 Tax=Labilibacter marinus TaxID=1477105 RepID=UPI00094FA2A8|nr:DUF3667 domain-containing protein [Labilibacter marinus]